MGNVILALFYTVNLTIVERFMSACEKVIPDWPQMLWLVTTIPWVSAVSLDTWLVTTLLQAALCSATWTLCSDHADPSLGFLSVKL